MVGGRDQGRPPTTPRRGSPRLICDRTFRGCVRPIIELTRRDPRVPLDDRRVDRRLAIGGKVALDRPTDQLGARLSGAPRPFVEEGDQLVGELDEDLAPCHCSHIVAYGRTTVYARQVAVAGTFLVPPGEGESVSLGGLGVVFKVTGEDTDGAFAVVEHPIEPGVLVPPHYHEREDELTYVIAGEIGARVGDRELTVPAGGYLWKPRLVPHAFWNASGARARILDVIVPAGFERFFRALAALIARGASTEEIDEAGRRYGHVIVPEWIEELERRHGVRVRG